MNAKPYYTLYGFTMSPFSMKMRSYMRYRRIPSIWVPGERASDVAQTKIPTYMVPVLDHNRNDGCLPASRQRYKDLSKDAKDLLGGLFKDTACYGYLTEAI